MTEEELALIRDIIGDTTPPTDADLEDYYEQLDGDVYGVARKVLKRRLANLTAAPSSFSVPGEYSQSTTANIATLERQLADLGGSGTAGGNTVRFVQPVRPDGR